MANNTQSIMISEHWIVNVSDLPPDWEEWDDVDLHEYVRDTYAPTCNVIRGDLPSTTANRKKSADKKEKSDGRNS